MKRLLLSYLPTAVLVLSGTLTHAQPTFVDLYYEDYHPNMGWRLNNGRIVDTQGNLRPDVHAASEGMGVNIYTCADNRLSFAWRTGTDLNRVDLTMIGETSSLIDPAFRDVKPGICNYYYPHTAPNGAEGVEWFSRTDYSGVYPSIDLITYSGSGGPKLAWMCLPGSDPNDIRLQFQGQDSLKVDDLSHVLHAYVDSTELLLPYVIAYQIVGNTVDTVSWEATWRDLNNNDQVGFEFGAYDNTLPLVFLVGMPPAAAGGGGGVDGLDWCTTLGYVSNAFGDLSGNFFLKAGTGGADGDLYVGGNTLAQAYPEITGSQTWQGGMDAVFGAFNYAPGAADDAQKRWLNYYGGSGEDKPVAMHHASDGTLWAVGWTGSSDVILEPDLNPQDGTYYQPGLQGVSDGFIARMDTTNGNLLRSTYFGGNGKEMLTAITEMSNGTIVLGGSTTTTTGQYASCNSTTGGLPLCDGAGADYQQTSNAGGTDALLARFDPNFNLLQSTFYGGPGDDLLYDLAFVPASTGANQRLVAVGSTTGTVPLGTNGDFQLAGQSGVRNGLLVTFDSTGTQKWGTTVHGVHSLQAATRALGSVVVMGATNVAQSTAVTCADSAGVLSICHPGGNAYTDSTVTYRDQYYAEFDPKSGGLNWATTYGNGDAQALFTDSIVNDYDPQTLPINRLMDLKADANGNVYGLGIYEDAWVYPWYYPSVSAYGYYNHTWDPNTGDDQTDVTLVCYRQDRSLYWAATFGAGFDSLQGVNEQLFHPYGSDLGRDLVLIEGEALYWVGSTGAQNFPLTAPPNGYLEDPSDMFWYGDQFDGFMTRMSLLDLNIGIDDDGSNASGAAAVWCVPNPATDGVVFIYNGSPVSNGSILVHDALGKLVLNTRLNASGSASVANLAAGTYHARLLDRSGTQLGGVRLLRSTR